MIILAYDHGAHELFQKIKKHLDDNGIKYKEYTSKEFDALDSAAKFAKKANEAIKKGSLGIYGCKSGIAMSMASNRAKGVRGALCYKPKIAEMSRKHNDANVCILPAEHISYRTAIKIINTFLNSEFLGDKYLARVKELESIN